MKINREYYKKHCKSDPNHINYKHLIATLESDVVTIDGKSSLLIGIDSITDYEMVSKMCREGKAEWLSIIGNGCELNVNSKIGFHNHNNGLFDPLIVNICPDSNFCDVVFNFMGRIDRTLTKAEELCFKIWVRNFFGLIVNKLIPSSEPMDCNDCNNCFCVHPK